MQSAQAEDSPESLNAFDQAFFGHIIFAVSNFVRTLWMGLTGARLVRAPLSGPTAHYYRQLTRMSSAFALVADFVPMVLGGNFKFREKLSGRLADVLAHLYKDRAIGSGEALRSALQDVCVTLTKTPRVAVEGERCPSREISIELLSLRDC